MTELMDSAHPCRNCWGGIYQNADGDWRHWPGSMRACPNGTCSVTAPGERSNGGVILAEVRPHAAPGTNPRQPWEVLPVRIIVCHYLEQQQADDSEAAHYWYVQFCKADGTCGYEADNRLRAWVQSERCDDDL